MKGKSVAPSAGRTFRAALERSQNGLGWVVTRIPFDAAAVWGSRGQLRVKGEINGFPFRTSLFPDGSGGHFLLVNKKMLAGGNTGPGLSARFRLEHDTAERVIAMPEELERAMAEAKPVRRWFDQLNPSARRDLCRYVLGVKSAEARVRRAEEVVERMLATMEAERDLPPLLRVAFARDPLAYRGWQRMSQRQRRIHLFGVSYYKTPAAQERRIGKLLDDARKHVHGRGHGLRSPNASGAGN